MTEPEEYLLRNATDKALREGKAMIGKRKATRQECAIELTRRITIRRNHPSNRPQ